MTDPFELIAAFVDGERVDPDALKLALCDPAGRDYLVDLVALRQVVQASEPASVARARPRSSRLRWAAAAAAAIALAGTVYVTSSQSDRPPAPDRVVKLDRGLDWRGN